MISIQLLCRMSKAQILTYSELNGRMAPKYPNSYSKCTCISVSCRWLKNMKVTETTINAKIVLI